MKFILVFVALFCLAQCQPKIELDKSNPTPGGSFGIDDRFETFLDTKEDKEVPTENSVKQEDKKITAQLFKATTCLYCICSKPNSYGYSHYALCYRCNDRSKCWRVCRGCYCSGRPYSIYDSYYGFCARCT